MQVIGISGGKGGVGKTNVAVNIAVALSKLNKEVVLFDADLGLANIDLLMGLKVRNTLANVISGECLLGDIIVTSQHGVRLIPAASGVIDMANLTHEDRASVITQLSDQVAADVLIVDTGAGIDETVQTFVAACQTAVLVVCDEPASLTDCYALIKVLRTSKKLKRFDILVNQVDNQQQGRMLFDRLSSVASKHLDVSLSYLGAVPADPYLKRAVQERRPLVEAYPRSPAAVALSACASRLADRAIKEPSSGMAFFLRDIWQPEP